MSKVLHTYQNGTYRVIICEDGTKVRTTDGEFFIPDFPESIDLKITNYCNLADLCIFCHEKSNIHGKHSDPNRIINFLEGLPAGVEIAIGGGNPLAHPDINYIVDELTNRGLVINMTINQEHYDKANIPENVRGVGISFRRRKELKLRHNHIIHHLILGIHAYDDFLWLCQTYMCPKILWLGFKSVGNGITYSKEYQVEIDAKIKDVVENSHEFLKHTDLVAFDNLAIEQIGSNNALFTKGDYMGDDGKFSFYYDAVEDKYAIGSSQKQRLPANDMIAIDCFNRI